MIDGWVLITVAIITAVAPTVAAIGAWRVAKRTHREINSRMTELLRIARAESYAKGVADQKAQEGSD